MPPATESHSRFIQISSSTTEHAGAVRVTVHALDESGQVWVLAAGSAGWTKLTDHRLT